MSQPAVNWSTLLDIASASDIGMRRTNNQDAFVVSMARSMTQWQERGHLLVVADGMGAHAAGELASRLAVDHISHLYYKFAEQSAPEALRRAVIEANAEINRRGQANEEFHNMGTTCCALILLPQGAVVAHVGDSRVYRLRGNRLEQLTFDHSLVWEMRASGQINPDSEAALSIPKNVITRSLGPYPEVKVDLEGPFPIEVGDTFLICSDGLSGQVADDELGSILANLDPQQAAKVLIDLANLRGGPDNITLIVVRIKDASLTSNLAKPLTIGAKKKKRRSLAVAWSVLGVGVVLAVTLRLITGSLVPAAIPAAAAVAALIWILVRISGVMGRGITVAPGKRFGRGPYTRVDCASGQRLVSQLELIISQLREAAIEEDWQIDLEQLDMFIAKARDASAKKEEASAIRQYSISISFLMDQLRQRNPANDSNIEI